MKKAQSAIEFMILIGGVIFFFSIMTLIFQQNIGEKTADKRRLLVQDLALAVQNEIDLASSSLDGYERTFNVPQYIINVNYTINISDGAVYIKTADNKHATALRIKNITGQLQKGSNTIRKQNSTVYLNTIP